MTRVEVTTAVQTILRQADLPLVLLSIQPLPFAWELRLEDRDGIQRVVTVHQGSNANITQAIACALRSGA